MATFLACPPESCQSGIGPVSPYGEGPVSAFHGRKQTGSNPPKAEIQTEALPNSPSASRVTGVILSYPNSRAAAWPAPVWRARQAQWQRFHEHQAAADRSYPAVPNAAPAAHTRTNRHQPQAHRNAVHFSQAGRG